MNQNHISIICFDLGSHCKVLSVSLCWFHRQSTGPDGIFSYVLCVQLRSSLIWDLVQCRLVVLFFTDVSGRIIGRISTGRAVQEEGYSTFEDVTGRLSRNVGSGLRCVKSLRSEEIIYTAAEAVITRCIQLIHKMIIEIEKTSLVAEMWRYVFKWDIMKRGKQCFVFPDFCNIEFFRLDLVYVFAHRW
jgi:hypothetical protein